MAIGGVFVLALLGVLIAPYFIDWTAYRADFEREASRILGHKVTVGGDAEARLLPFPSVTFTQVSVEGEDGQGPLLTVDRFRMDAELAPYLSGELRIFSMSLERPKLRLSVSREGRVAIGRAGALPTAATVVLEDVAIEDGEILVENGYSGRSLSMRVVNAGFSAQSLAGPFAGAGQIVAAGRPMSFQLSAGAATVGEPLPMKLTVEDRALSLSVVADGTANLSAGMPTFEGTFRAASPLPPDPAAGDRAAPPPAAPLAPFALVAHAGASAKALDLTDMRVTVPGGERPYVLTGTGSLGLGRLPSFALSLAGEQVDVDSLADGSRDQTVPATFERRLAAARAVLARIPKPTIPGSLTLSLPVVVAGDTTIRDVGFTLAPADAGWSVEGFAAELPGRTRLEASGLLDVADTVAFRGSLLLASRQPSGFSDWLTGAVDPAIRALPQAGFSASVDLSPERQVLEDLEVDVGGDTLRGRLERSGAVGARVLDADLSGGRVDLDALLALSRIFTGEADAFAAATTGRLRFAAGPVSAAGVSAERIDADVAYDGERLTLSRLDLAELAGSDVSASGALAGLRGDLSGRIDLSLETPQPLELIEFLEGRVPDSPVLAALRERAPSLGPLALTGVLATEPGASGERATLAANLSGTAAGTEVTLSMTLGNGIYAGGTTGRFALDVRFSNGEPSVLLGQVGVETLPLPVPSPLSLALSLSAEATGPVAARAALEAPGTRLAAEGTLGVTTTGIGSADLKLSGHSDDLSPWLLALGNPLADPAGPALPLVAGGQLGIADGTVTLSGFEGSLGPVDASADLERAPAGPISGNVFLSDLSLPLLAKLVYGRAPDERGPDESRDGGWSAQSFALPPGGGASLALQVTADRMTLAPGAALGEASARLSGTASDLRLDDLRGTLGGGYAAGSLSLRNANGVGGVSLNADLQGIDLGTVALSGFALPSEDEEEGPPAPDPGVVGTLDARVSLDATGQSYAALLASAAGAAHVEVEDASFRGLRPGLLPDILAASDAEGFEATEPGVAALFARLSDGRYPVASLATDIAVAGGTARMPPVTVARPGESLTLEGAVDLSDLALSGALRLDLDPGDDAVEGAAPAVTLALSGTLPQPQLTADVRPLANFLSVRALEREQARVEAMQEALGEKLRLRREARYARWREERRLAAAEAAAAGERIRLDDDRRRREAAAERARVEAAEREAARQREAEAAADERRREEAAEAARREAAERERRRAQQTPASPPVPSFEAPSFQTPAIPARPPATGLPGVRTPAPF